MNILISNDDGLMANGIRALTEALSCEHDVYVIAPDRERSAAGHSLTLHTPLRVEELDPKFGAKRNWVTTGTPGDCVKIGLSAILEPHEMPDLVISGNPFSTPCINAGFKKCFCPLAGNVCFVPQPHFPKDFCFWWDGLSPPQGAHGSAGYLATVPERCIAIAFCCDLVSSLSGTTLAVPE